VEGKYLGMKKQTCIFVIIPIHNGIKNTIRCLNNLQNLTYSNFKVIVIDDGSSDGSYDYIKSHYPEIVLLKGKGNLWWSGSVNLGVKYALRNNADFICLLNNDNIFRDDFLSIMVETADKKDVQAVCSKVYYKDSDVVFYAGGSRSRWGELKILDGYDRQEYNDEKMTNWTTGMGVLIKSQVFRDIGLFDEKNFPQYYGDSDLGLRMNNHGYKIFYQPKSVIYNDSIFTGLSSYSGKLWDFLRSFFSIRSINNIRICFRFYRKHAPKFAFFLTCKMIVRSIYGYFRTLFTRKTKLEIKQCR